MQGYQVQFQPKWEFFNINLLFKSFKKANLFRTMIFIGMALFGALNKTSAQTASPEVFCSKAYQGNVYCTDGVDYWFHAENNNSVRFKFLQGRNPNFQLESLYTNPENNILKNGGFEENIASWIISTNIRGAPDWSISHNEVTDGISSAILVKSTSGGDVTSISQEVNVKPDTLYNISAWMRLDEQIGSGGRYGLSVDGHDIRGGTSHPGGDFKLFVADRKWMHHKGTILTGPSTNKIVVRAYTNSGFAGKALIDQVLLTPAYSVSGNLLKNGGFESDRNDWEKLAAGAAGWSVSSDVKADGKYSVRLKKTNRSTATHINQNFDLKPNTKYILSAWTRLDAKNWNGAFGIQIDNHELTSRFRAYNANQIWEYHEGTFHTGGGVNGRGNLRIWANSVFLGTAYVDNVQLKEVYSQQGADPAFADIVNSTGNLIPLSEVSASKIELNKSILENDVNDGLLLTPGGEDRYGLKTIFATNIRGDRKDNWSRWYQEYGNTQIFRLFEGEHRSSTLPGSFSNISA